LVREGDGFGCEGVNSREGKSADEEIGVPGKPKVKGAGRMPALRKARRICEDEVRAKWRVMSGRICEIDFERKTAMYLRLEIFRGLIFL
jgi:hypothetical protein